MDNAMDIIIICSNLLTAKNIGVIDTPILFRVNLLERLKDMLQDEFCMWIFDAVVNRDADNEFSITNIIAPWNE